MRDGEAQVDGGGGGKMGIGEFLEASLVLMARSNTVVGLSRASFEDSKFEIGMPRGKRRGGDEVKGQRTRRTPPTPAAVLVGTCRPLRV